MKKLTTILLALVMMLALVACAPAAPVATPTPAAPTATPEAPAPAGPVAEEVKGVTIPTFSVTVNGVAVTQAEMAAFPMYSVVATSVNSAGTESATTYVGFAMKDVLAAAKLSEAYVWLEATADDGYALTFTGDVINADTTLLAMTKDGSPFSAAPWFAPCTDTTTGNYLKGCVSILVNTTEGAPDITAPDATPAAGGTTGALPEILDRTDKVTFQAFSFKVNGKEVNNDTMKGAKIFKITATALSKTGEAVESAYTGYTLKDVLAAAGVTGYTKATVVANDGYETELAAELIDSEYTLVALEKDKELGEGGTVWVAPCTQTESKSYCKLVVDIVTQ